MDLNLIWYILLSVLLIGYAILDGFDLGVGALYLFSKGDVERRTLLNSIGADTEYQGGFFNLSTFTMHGAIYLYLKTEGDLLQKVKKWVVHSTATFVVLYIITTIATLIQVPSMTENFKNFPIAWLLVIINILAIANIPRCLYNNTPGQAFISSALVIAMLIGLFGIGVFPNMIASSIDEAYNLTIYTAASSAKTLWIMLIIAIIGIPCVLSYTIAIYWVFRGKVNLDEFSY